MCAIEKIIYILVSKLQVFHADFGFFFSFLFIIVKVTFKNKHFGNLEKNYKTIKFKYIAFLFTTYPLTQFSRFVFLSNAHFSPALHFLFPQYVPVADDAVK